MERFGAWVIAGVAGVVGVAQAAVGPDLERAVTREREAAVGAQHDVLRSYGARRGRRRSSLRERWGRCA